MTDDHLSLAELAELDEGLLSSDRISAIRAHLHGCDSCRAKAEAIVTTRSALSGLPPVTMPANVRERIDNALADEAHDDADVAVPAPRAVELSVVEDTEPRIDAGPRLDTDAGVTPPATGRTLQTSDVVPASGRLLRSRFGRPSMAASAAAAAVVLAAGAIITGHLLHHHSSTGANSAAAGVGSATDNNPFLSHGEQPSSVVESATGMTYTAANLSASVKNVLTSSSATGPITPSPSNSGSDEAGSGGAAAKPRHSGKHPTAGTDADKATTAAPDTESTLIATPTKPIPKSLRPLFQSKAKIIQCAVLLTGQQDAVPEHVDFGRWTGGTLHAAPSAIFIFRGTTPSTVAVWVVNPTCSGNDLVRTVSQVTISN